MSRPERTGVIRRPDAAAREIAGAAASFAAGIRIAIPDATVIPGKPVAVAIDIRNPTNLVDAFDVVVLGFEHGTVAIAPDALSLFPDQRGTIAATITLPDDFPAGPYTATIKVASRTNPALVAIKPLTLTVAGRAVASMGLDPDAVVGRRSGRFSVTMHNAGNAPMEVRLVPNDDQNHFEYEVSPPDRLIVPAGTSRSVQLIVKGRRSFTGTAVPRRFTITAESPDFEPQIKPATFAQEPYVPRLVMMFGTVLAMLALWALAVGGGISSVIGDARGDVSKSFEKGAGAIADQLAAKQDATTQLAEARSDLLTASLTTGAGNGTSGSGIQVGPRGLIATIPTGSGDGSGNAGAGDGAETGPGGAAATTPADATNPATAAPPDALAGTVVAASDRRPVPVATMTIRAIVPTLGRADPNQAPIVVTTDATGRFQQLELVPGTYSVVFAAAGYGDVLCAKVVIPVAASGPLGSCTTITDAGATKVTPGPASVVTLTGRQASIAGIVSQDGAPLAGAAVEVFRLDAVTGAPTAITGIDPDLTQPGEGRFSFVFEPSTNATPGTFEVVISAPDFVGDRRIVELAAGQHVVDIEIPLSAIPPTTLPPAQRQVSGTVTDAATRAPLANVAVRITGAVSTLELSTLDNGTYSMTDLAPGRYNVAFSKPGYAPTTRELSVPAGAGESGSVALTSLPVPIQGSVIGQMARDVDPDAASLLTPVPMAGAEITDAGGSVIARTDAAGAWITTTSFPAGPVKLTVSAAGYVSHTFEVAVAPPAPAITQPITLVGWDAWTIPIGTPISSGLVTALLECTGEPPGVYTTPTVPTQVTALRWSSPDGGVGDITPAPSARIITGPSGSTLLAVTAPRRGRIELAIGGPPGLYTPTLTIADLATPPSSVVVDFAGPGWVTDTAELPVEGYTAGGSCLSLESNGAPLPAIGRTFVAADQTGRRATFIVNQLSPNLPVSVTNPAGQAMTATPSPTGTFH